MAQGYPSRLKSKHKKRGNTEYISINVKGGIVYNTIESFKDIYWDIRPRPDFGTIEFRVCDLPLTITETLRLVAIWAWPAMPAKCEALWTVLGLPGNPGQQKDTDAQPRFGAGDGRAIGESQILFPRIDLKSVAGA